MSNNNPVDFFLFTQQRASQGKKHKNKEPTKLAGSSKKQEIQRKSNYRKRCLVTSLLKRVKSKVAGNTDKGREFQSSPVETKKE